MDINKISEEFGKATRFVAEKTGKLVESAKLSYAASDILTKLEKTYASVGKKFYEECICENNIPDNFGEEFDRIAELKTELEFAKDKISEINCKKRCPSCSHAIDESDLFCRKCGAKF